MRSSVGQQVDDALDLRQGEGPEEYGVVEPVQELRPEVQPQLPHDRVASRLADLAAIGDPLDEELRADVRGQNDHRVLEVHRAPLGVRQAAVVEQLEKDVEDVVVGLLDLVEQDDAVGSPPHRFGELTTLLVADVAGGGADQPRDGVLLHVLRHVDAHQVLLAVEERPRQGLGELGLADARGAEEEERADRPARVLDSGARAEHGVGHRLHRLVLADDALVQDGLEAQELLLLPFDQPGDRDAGPARDDLRDLVAR